MFDEKLLDGLSFRELNQTLDYVLERMEKIKDGLSEGKDDPRLDMLCIVANKIVMRMDSIVRQNAPPQHEVIAQWNKLMKGYEEHFEKYTDILLEEDTLLDFEPPKSS